MIYNVTWDRTSVPDKWHLIPFNGFSRLHECECVTDDVYTDGETTLR